MTKTLYSVSARKYGFKAVISAGIASALSTVATAETVDFKQVCRTVSSPGLTRTINKTYVTGDDDPILDYDTRKERDPIVATFLYTEGDDLGTDDFDAHEFFMELAEYTTTALPLQIITAPKSFATGNFQYTSSSTETYIRRVSPLEGGADDNNRLAFTAEFETTSWTKSVVA